MRNKETSEVRSRAARGRRMRKDGGSVSQATKRALADSLKKALLTTPLDKITVIDLVADCGVNRQTFYYHFQDIYDLLSWTFETDLREAVDASMNATHNWTAALTGALERMQSERTLIRNAFHCIPKEIVAARTIDVLQPIVTQVLLKSPNIDRLSEEDRQFTYRFFTFAFTGLLLTWINENMKTPPEELVASLTHMLTQLSLTDPSGLFLAVPLS